MQTGADVSALALLPQYQPVMASPEGAWPSSGTILWMATALRASP
jgi:hypothetical protein